MPSYAIMTFGCQMNVHDSERMHEVLRNAGYAQSELAQADVIVLNTCSVREKAEQKLRSEVGRLTLRKRERPDLTLVVAGCVAQQEGARMLKKMRALDIVIGPDNIAELPRLLREVALGSPPLVHTVFDTETPRFLTALSVAGASKTAFVTIMKGCDERCSFCIVPYTRGPERYRASAEIVAEIAALVGAGVREITLLGQTVNSYRDPSLPREPGAPLDTDESDFPALLRRIAAEVPGLVRLRYTSPHPRHLTPSLVRAHGDLPVLARHLHLPVQSGSDRVLKRMIRRYTRAEYIERITSLVVAVPGLTLSTDIIVGFPGETEEDFAETLSLVREIGYAGLFGFKYSERPRTPARKLADDVSEEVKSERLARLFALSESLLATHLAGLVGTTQQVLVEGTDPETGALWSGRTVRNEIVHIAGATDRDLAGDVVEVTITRSNRHSMMGQLTEKARHVARERSTPEPVEARPLASTPALPSSGPPRRSLPLLVEGT